MQRILFFCFILGFFFWIFITRASGQQPLEQYCPHAYSQTGVCPQEVCRLGCFAGIEYEGCTPECLPKSCVELDVEHCPKDTCQVLKGCADKDICFYKAQAEPLSCGDSAYAGILECCEGLVKRCGIEFFDGSCDMVGEYSMYGAAICIPCGDGICNQFENHCNCPEDC